MKQKQKDRLIKVIKRGANIINNYFRRKPGGWDTCVVGEMALECGMTPEEFRYNNNTGVSNPNFPNELKKKLCESYGIGDYQLYKLQYFNDMTSDTCERKKVLLQLVDQWPMEAEGESDNE
jgi:hypothetical protein